MLEQTRALLPWFAEEAAEAEQAGRVSPEAFDALAEAGILKMCAPRKYGGHELDFRTQCDVLSELATACPSTSWVATILSALGWVAGTFPDEAQDEVLGSGDPRISAALSATGTLEAVDGGYRLNGRWGYNTGGHGSEWVVVNSLLGELPVVVLVRSSEITRLDDWHPMGMAATGSNTIEAHDVFVPSHRAQALPPMLNGEYTTDRHNADEPYFRLPAASVLAVNAGGTPVGTAHGALDAFMQRLEGRAITYTFYEVQSEAPITHLQVAEASLLIDSADAHVSLACALLDNASGSGPTFADRVKARAHIGYSTGLSRQAVDLLFHASGASCIQADVPIQRFQRDIQSLANHGIMHAPTNIETYGRVLCGLEPNTFLV